MGVSINTNKTLGVSTGTSIIAPQTSFVNTHSVELDGIDAYVNVADNNNLSFGDGSSDSAFSISAWIRPDDNDKFRIIFKYNVTTSLREYYFQTAGGLKLQAGLYDAGTAASLTRNGNTTIPENVWSHVVMTYNGNGLNTGIKIYLNGSLDNGSVSGGGSYTAMHNTNEPLLIGKFNGSTPSFANGEIDEVAIFNKALSASKIQQIYNATAVVGGVPQTANLFTGGLDTSLVYWNRMGDS